MTGFDVIENGYLMERSGGRYEYEKHEKQLVTIFRSGFFSSISQEYVATGDKTLEQMGRLALETKDFIYSIHIIPFGLGAMIFYYLLYQSNVLPKVSIH